MACYQNLLGIFPNFFDFQLHCASSSQMKKLALRPKRCESNLLYLSLWKQKKTYYQIWIEILDMADANFCEGTLSFRYWWCDNLSCRLSPVHPSRIVRQGLNFMMGWQATVNISLAFKSINITSSYCRVRDFDDVNQHMCWRPIKSHIICPQITSQPKVAQLWGRQARLRSPPCLWCLFSPAVSILPK